MGQEDALEKEMSTHLGILTWRIQWREEPGGYSPWGSKESDTTERLHFLLKIKTALKASSVLFSADLSEVPTSTRAQ